MKPDPERRLKNGTVFRQNASVRSYSCLRRATLPLCWFRPKNCLPVYIKADPPCYYRALLLFDSFEDSHCEFHRCPQPLPFPFRSLHSNYSPRSAITRASPSCCTTVKLQIQILQSLNTIVCFKADRWRGVRPLRTVPIR